MGNPPLSALLDQVRAATDEATAILRDVAAANGTTPIRRHPAGAHLAITLRLGHRLIAGTTGPCPHLKPNAPQPMYWAAWRPGLIRCGACMTRATDAITGADEDRRCDCCRRIRRTVIPGVIQIPATVVPQLPLAHGPIACVFGLCPGCQATTGVEPAPDPPPPARGAR